MSSRRSRQQYFDDLDTDYDLDEDELNGFDLDVAEYRPPRKAKKAKRQQRERGTAVEEPNDEFDDLEYRDDVERRAREKRRAGISEPFKCRNCKAFIGEPPTGGQQRNHCPMCLYSLHVDDKTPGDRASECRSLMQPVGVFYRRNLEQVVVHRCLGCGFVRYNRIAADDNPVVLNQLPIVDPPD